ncbi:hypothetical protein TRVL_02261 [Trypanosoma vivax]|nr:hypothetical protein TRVL_02261 [Trypanosoma vivax]
MLTVIFAQSVKDFNIREGQAHVSLLPVAPARPRIYTPRVNLVLEYCPSACSAQTNLPSPSARAFLWYVGRRLRKATPNSTLVSESTAPTPLSPRAAVASGVAKSTHFTKCAILCQGIVH